MRRRAKISLGALGALVIMIAAGVIIFTQTDYGRGRVRGILLSRLESSAHGRVSMGPVRGNLLDGATIEGLVIQDSTGAPFFSADTIFIDYSLWGLVRQRLDLDAARLVRPVLVLDRPPGLTWNFSRIFPSDTTRAPSRQGFGAWINVRNLDVVEGRVLVQDEWQPDGALPEDERVLAIREALSGSSRLLVVEVPGGYQSIQDYQSLNGHFDRLRLANPDSAAIVVDVDQLSMRAFPFRPPAAEVRSLTGRIISSGDTLTAENVQLGLPGTRMALNGSYLLSGGISAAAVANPIAFADLRFLYPELPEGSGVLDLTVARRGERTRVVARRIEAAMEGATLAGNADVTFGDSLRLGPTDIQFAGVETSLIEQLAPDVEIPREGTLAGGVALTGAQDELTVDGNVSFADRAGRVSELFADGIIGSGAGGIRAQNLRLRLEPLQMTLVSAAGADVPVGGVITGEATLTGTVDTGFDIEGDLAHQSAETGRSRVLIDGEITRSGDEFGPRDLALRLDPVQLALARAFAPDLPLTGAVTGNARLNGNLSDLQLDADLVHDGGGTGRSRLLASGGLALGEAPAARRLRLTFDPLQVELAKVFAPDLPINGVITGTALLDGNTDALTLAADLTHTSAATGRSHLTAEGGLALGDQPRARALRLTFDPVQLALAQAFAPDLELDGVVTGSARLDGTAEALTVAADLTHNSDATGRSHLTARGGVSLGDQPRARGLTLDLDPVQVALIREFSPDLALDGSISGTTTLTGTQTDLQLAANLVHSSPSAGTSRITAAGGVGLGETFRARNLRLGFDPMQLAVAGAFDPELPLDGTLSGTATLNGSTATRMAVVTDITHSGSTGLSRLAGTADVPFNRRGVVSANMRVFPLSLATVGRFAPAAGLRGSVTGEVEASGSMRDLALDLGLTVQDGGTIDLAGRLDLESAVPTYDFAGTFGDFNAAAVTERAPVTQVSGAASAVGRGTDPATMNASIMADLAGSVDKYAADLVQVQTTLADGLATVQRGRVELATASADVSGSLGLVEGRSGTLQYAVRLDSLSQLSGIVPTDSALVAPRPAEIARALARARADSARIAAATEVERAATGLPPPPPLVFDSVPPLPRDSLSGSLNASGVLAGNVKRFDVSGQAEMRDLVAFGNKVETGDVTYSWLGAPGANSQLEFDAELDQARISGFAVDSVAAHVRYQGDFGEGAGTIDLAVVQDETRDYTAQADFLLSADRREVSYSDLALRFDTIQWRSLRPGTVSWAAGGVELEDIELASNDGGRIFAEGRVPAEGEADLRLDIQNVQVADILGMLQDTVPIRGRVSLAADIRGNAAAPVIDGTLAMREIVVDTVAVPDLTGTFDYADRELRAEATAADSVRILLTATGRLPINLALSGVTGPRFAADAPLELDVHADSLPLESLPSFTTAVEDVRGRVVGDLRIRGTREDPQLSGVVDLDLGSMTVVVPGLALEQVAGTLRLDRNRVLVDSVSALSGEGTIRVTGELGVESLTEPTFDLQVVSSEAEIINNEQGRLEADATLAVVGPWDGAEITGNVQIRRGVIRPPEQGAPRRTELDAPQVEALGDTAAIRIAQVNPLLANLRANINVGIDRNTWVRNIAANVEIFTPPDSRPLLIQMTAGPQTVSINGTVNIGRGEYTFAGRRITLAQGAIVFVGETPINPILQITAEQQVRLAGRPSFAIQVLLGGTMRTPRVTVTSNAQPPIAESDLLSYFAFGESSSSLIQAESGGSVGGATSGGGALLGPVGALATQQLGATAVGTVVDQLEHGARRSLGLDVLNISPAPIPAELAVEGYLNTFRGAQFEAGSYLTDRLFIAGQGRTAAVLPGLRLEYRTPSGFEMITSWEPRYLVPEPSLTVQTKPETEKVIGLFLQWRRRF